MSNKYKECKQYNRDGNCIIPTFYGQAENATTCTDTIKMVDEYP